MIRAPREEALERWDTLPDTIREALFSEENADLIEQVGATYSLPPEALHNLALAVSNVLHGFVHPSDFAKEISEIPGIRPELAPQIASAIDTKIFAPLKPELESMYGPPGGAPTVTPPQSQAQQLQITHIPTAVTSEPTSEQNTLLKPSINETPFILHNEEEIKPQVEAAPVETSPLRPMFYKAPTAAPQVEERVLESRPIAARLELGVEAQPVVESAPKMSRTPREEVRQVNYSEFRTPLNNPFAGTPKPKENEQKPVQESATGTYNKNEPAKKPIVPDTNVVNLKDLPL